MRVTEERPDHYEAGYNRPDIVVFKPQAEFDRRKAIIARERDHFTAYNSLLMLINDLKSYILGENEELKEEVEAITHVLASDEDNEYSKKTRISYNYDIGMSTILYDSVPMETTEATFKDALTHSEREGTMVMIRKLWCMYGSLQTIAFREGIFNLEGWEIDYTLRDEIMDSIGED